MPFEPVFTITNDTANALTVIERARGFLEAANLSREWLHEMQDRALSLEAHYTTHIEGTQLTLEQSQQLLSGQILPDVDPDDVKELLNYRYAFELVASYLGEGAAITQALIREIHKRLVENVRGNSATPGEYRKIQNYVVNSNTKEIIYTPPPVYKIPHLMVDLIAWLNSEVSINPILTAGIAQFQLVHIHPFLDGNGRTARLLSTLCLYQKGYDFKRLFTLSEYYDRSRADYYRAIQQVRENNLDMTHWLEYFSQGLATQLQEIRGLGEKIIKRDVIAQKHQLSNRQKTVLYYTMQHDKISIQDYETLCPDVSRRTLQRELQDMVKKGLFTTEGSTNKLFYCFKN